MPAIMRLSWFLSLWAAVLLAGGCTAEEQTPRGPVVLAAASLQGALEDVASQWTGQGHSPPVLSFSATPAVARQIANGAPADLVITADAQWMNWLEQRGFVREETRRDLLGNRLVLVRPSGGHVTSLDMLGKGQKLALAEPETVPAGRYAKASLMTLAQWDKVARHVVPAESARAALALAERGEVELAIVYASDAQASRTVKIVAEFPSASYPPIRYPLAIVAGSDHSQSNDFATYLASEEALAIFARHGFTPAP